LKLDNRRSDSEAAFRVAGPLRRLRLRAHNLTPFGLSVCRSMSGRESPVTSTVVEEVRLDAGLLGGLVAVLLLTG